MKSPSTSYIGIGVVALVSLFAILAMSGGAQAAFSTQSVSQVLYAAVMDAVTPGWLSAIEDMLVDENGFTPQAFAPPPYYDETEEGEDDGGSTVNSCNSIPRAFCYPLGEQAPDGATRLEEYDGLPTTCGYTCQISPCPPPGASGECWQCPTDRPKYNGIDHTCIPEDERIVPRCERTEGQRCFIGIFDDATMEFATGTNQETSCNPWDGITFGGGDIFFTVQGCAVCDEGYHWEPEEWSPRVGHKEDYYVGGNDPAMGCVAD